MGGEEDGGEQGILFRPCLCSGSMAFVHVGCLAHWRCVSNNPRSFYRCDQCHYEYRFARVFQAYGYGFDKFTLARVLGMRGSVFTASVLVLLSVVFLGGFIFKVFSPGVTWAEVFRCFNWMHLAGGSAVVGAGSVLSFLVASCPGLGNHYLFWGGRVWGGGGGSNGNNKLLLIILGIMVIIGLLLALRWIFTRISEYAQTTLRHTQFTVLEYDPARARRRQEEQQEQTTEESPF